MSDVYDLVLEFNYFVHCELVCNSVICRVITILQEEQLQ